MLDITMDVYPNMVHSGTSKAGNPYIMQTAYIQLPNEPHPSKVKIFVDEPIQPGHYKVDVPASLYVENEQLRFGRLVYTEQKAENKPTSLAAK